MKVLGVLTQDFAAYYDVVKALKARGVPFLSLVEDQPVPAHVGALIVAPTDPEPPVDVPVVVYDPEGEAATGGSTVGEGTGEVYASVADAVEAALRHLRGRVAFRRVVVGVDPGEHPGVAILGDGRVVSTFRSSRPEDVVPEILRRLGALEAESSVVRVGHGSATHRDRIINGLLDAVVDVAVEEVDETRTSPPRHRPNRERDIAAAKRIALARGERVRRRREVSPSEGELRDIQRRSRLASQGDVTIGRELARAVASGDLTLEEALEEQRGRRSSA